MNGKEERPMQPKIIETFGENYFGRYDQTRTGCRAIIVRDGNILLSYETVTDQWMIPGGGLEDGESFAECCVREVGEETGCLIRPSECLFELDEYYEHCKYIDYYFAGEIIGTAERHLTEREREVGMEPRWIPLAEAIEIFSHHADWTDIDEMRRGMYLREYKALCEYATQSKN